MEKITNYDKITGDRNLINVKGEMVMKKRYLAMVLAFCLMLSSIVTEGSLLSVSASEVPSETEDAEIPVEETEEVETPAEASDKLADEEEIQTEDTEVEEAKEQEDFLKQIHQAAEEGIGEENAGYVAELKQKLAASQSKNRSYVEGMIANTWLEIAINNEGNFTIGTAEGNPNYTSDNNKILLYGHPSPWSSETLIWVDGEEWFFYADSIVKSETENAYIATMDVGDTGVIVTQTLSFYTNSSTGRADTVRIAYDVNNSSAVDHQVGIRIMMDTMLADNDDAPFKVAGYGNVTEAKVLSGSAITQTYQVYDDLDAPTTMATGTLWMENERRPDKVQYCNWGGINGSYWEHQVEDGDYLGDSAVGIYYNPISVAAGGGISVATYYGTGMGLGGSQGGSTPIEDMIGSNDFDVYVTDARTGKPISSATVELEGIGSEVTNADGKVRFGNIDNGKNGQTVNMKITHAQYQEKVTPVKLVLASCRTMLLRGTDDTQPLVEEVVMTSGNEKYNNVDLLTSTVYFNSNPEKVEATRGNTEEVTITARASVGDASGNCVYQLISDEKVVIENDTGVFKIKTLTSNNKGKTYTTNRICDFEEGKKIYLQVISPEGEVSWKTLLGISVSAPTTYATTLKSNASFMAKVDFDSLGDAKEIVELLLGSEVDNFGADLFPLEVEIDEDGKLKVAYNKKSEKSWESFKSDYNKAVVNRSGALKKLGGKTGSIGAGKAKVGLSLAGYGEGYIENGKANVRLGIIGTVSGSASYTHTFFVGWLPLYIKVGAKAKAPLEVQASVVMDNKLSLQVTEGKFEPSLSLYAELGAGVSDILSAGVQGKGTLKYLADFNEDYYALTLSGKASLEVHALLFSNSLDIAEKTWTLYDSNAGRQAEAAAAKNNSVYNPENFELTPRTWQNIPKGRILQTEEWNSGVYTDARPVMVKAGEEVYRFWIGDIEERSDANYMAVVYSRYDSINGNWSEPEILADNGTGDYSFHVAVAGTDIYVIYQEAKKEYTDEEFEAIKTMGSADAIALLTGDSRVAIAKVNGADGTAEDIGVIYEDASPTGALGALSPRISVNGKSAEAVWYSNSNNNILGQCENTEAGENTVYHAEISLDTGKVVGEIKHFSVGQNALTSLDVGMLNGSQQIAYVLDLDDDLTTISDRELYLADNLELAMSRQKITKATANAVSAENPVFAKIGGTDSLIWYEGGNYYYTTSTMEEKKTVFSQENIPAAANSGYTVLEDGTDTAIVWLATGSASDEEERYVSLYGTKLQNGTFGTAYEMAQVSDVENPMVFSLSGYMEEGKCVTSFALKKYDGSYLEKSSLCGVKEEVVTAAELTDVYYDVTQAVSGEEITLDVTIKNVGTAPIETIPLFIDSSSVEITNMGLWPGEEKTYSISAVLPEIYGAGTCSVSLAEEYSNGAEWRGRGQELFEIYVNYADISVSEGERVIAGNSEYYSFVVKNEGRLEAEDVNFKIMLDNNENGAVAYDYSFAEPLKPGESCTLFCQADALQGAAVAYKRLTTSTEELVTENNGGIVCINTEVPDVIENHILTVLSAGTEGGIVEQPEGFESIDNGWQKECATNDAVNVSAVPATGYAFVGWKIEGKGSVADEHNPNTAYYMGNADTVLTAEFATENHMTGITLPEKISVNYGETYEFAPQMTPTDSSDYLIWSSDNEDIAVVDADGLLTAKAVGTANITVQSSYDENVKAVCTVTVQKVMLQGLRMVFPKLELAGIGIEEELRVLKTPLNATEDITYTSNHPEFVIVDENGKITTVAPGTAVITATGRESNLSASCTITVTVPMTGIYFENRILNMLKGETVQTAYIENPVNTTDSPLPEEIRWSCSDSEVALITPSEDRRSVMVQAVGTGTATVTVNVKDNFYASFTVSVRQLIEGLSFAEQEIRVVKGKRQWLEVTKIPADGQGEIYWSSSNPKVAEVDDEGYLYANEAGTAVITARADTGCSASCNVTVYTDEIIVTSVADFESSHNYENNLDRTWVYTDAEAVSLTAVFSQKCQTEEDWDNIYIYDKNGTLVGEYTDNQLAGRTVTVEGNTIKVRLVTDGSYTEYGFKVDSIQPTYPPAADAGSDAGNGTTADTRKNIADAQISVASCTYSGKSLKPKVTVKLKNKSLKAGTDYTLSYKNNVNAGKGTVTIKGKGNYKGTKAKNFTIQPKMLKSSNVGTVYNMVYTGKALSPRPEVVENGKTLKQNRDYKLSYSNNKKVGTKAVVKVTGKGNYKGTVSKTFTIVKKANVINAKNTKIQAIGDKTYTGRAIKPSLTVKRNGKKLHSSDYSVEYRDTTKVGEAAAIVHGKGKYGGSVSITFHIAPKSASIKKVASIKTKTAEVTFKKAAGASCYKIYFAEEKNGKYKAAGSTEKTKYTIKKLKKGKTYYIKVRSYTKVGKTIYYGGYSKVKTVKVK